MSSYSTLVFRQGTSMATVHGRPTQGDQTWNDVRAGQGCLPESISWNIATHKSWNPNELGFQGWNGTQSSLGIRQKQQQILDSLPSATKFITNSRSECLRLHGIAYIIMEFKSSDKTWEILKISIGIFWFQGMREGGRSDSRSVSQSVSRATYRNWDTWICHRPDGRTRTAEGGTEGTFQSSSSSDFSAE